MSNANLSFGVTIASAILLKKPPPVVSKHFWYFLRSFSSILLAFFLAFSTCLFTLLIFLAHLPLLSSKYLSVLFQPGQAEQSLPVTFSYLKS
jgi:hypothetical protein